MIVNKWPDIAGQDIEAVINQLTIGELSSAGKIKVINELENKFSKLTNCTYALAVSSGTMALYSALFAIGIEPGDEVIVPIYTYHAVAAPLISMNAIPIFADIDEVYGHITVDSIKSCISNKTKAIIVVHSYGYVVDMDPIIDLAAQKNLKVIEDCSHSHGASYKGRTVGGIGDIGFFSLQASKLVPAGEGGIIVTSDKIIYEKVLLLGQHFDRTSIEVTDHYLQKFVRTGLGLKLRINPLGAALSNSQFDRLYEFIRKRNETYMYIANKLSNLENIMPILPKDYMTISTFYSYRFKFRASLKEFNVFMDVLTNLNADISIPSAIPLIEENIFNDTIFDFGIIKKRKTKKILRNNQNKYKGAEQFLKTIFRVPQYYKNLEEIDEIIKQIQYAYFTIFDHN